MIKGLLFLFQLNFKSNLNHLNLIVNQQILLENRYLWKYSFFFCLDLIQSFFPHRHPPPHHPSNHQPLTHLFLSGEASLMSLWSLEGRALVLLRWAKLSLSLRPGGQWLMAVAAQYTSQLMKSMYDSGRICQLCPHQTNPFLPVWPVWRGQNDAMCCYYAAYYAGCGFCNQMKPVLLVDLLTILIFVIFKSWHKC